MRLETVGKFVKEQQRWKQYGSSAVSTLATTGSRMYVLILHIDMFGARALPGRYPLAKVWHVSSAQTLYVS